MSKLVKILSSTEVKRSKVNFARTSKTKYHSSQGLYARVFGQPRRWKFRCHYVGRDLMLKHLWTCLHLRFSFFFSCFNINVYVVFPLLKMFIKAYSGKKLGYFHAVFAKDAYIKRSSYMHIHGLHRAVMEGG